MKYVLLKDGSVLTCTTEQYQKLTIAILSHPLETKVKLGGKTFRLEQVEDNPNKIAKHQQTTLNLQKKA